MHRFLSLGLTLSLLGCTGGPDMAGFGGQGTSALYALCLKRCAHIHAENCFEAPATEVSSCSSECQNATMLADNACTDEEAAILACEAEAKVLCTGPLEGTPEPQGCEAEKLARDECREPGVACVRVPSSDGLCGSGLFFECQQGANPGLGCVQVTLTGFCCS